MRQEPSPEESMCVEPTSNISTSRTSTQTHGFLLTLGQINPENLLTLIGRPQASDRVRM